jgi:hypothetical protein
VLTPPAPWHGAQIVAKRSPPAGVDAATCAVAVPAVASIAAATLARAAKRAVAAAPLVLTCGS